MILARLRALSRNRFSLSQRFTSRTTKLNASSKTESTGHDKPLKLQEENDLDKPVEYSKTKAASWLAKHSRCPEDNKPSYQSFVISGSLAVFMIYFFILREENDLDILFERPLSDIIEGIDETMPRTSMPRQ